MEIVVMIIMLLVCLGFVLKLSWHGAVGMALTAFVAALFVWLGVGRAVEQSKTLIAEWLQQPELMLDMSVLLTIDVLFQISFCVLMGRRIAGSRLSRWENIALAFTLRFPGILIFPVLFAMLVETIFSFPGCDFNTLAVVLALVVLVAVPLLSRAMRLLVPEKDLRLELLFLVNGMIAALGVVATVNGRTAATGTDSVNPGALCGVLTLLALGAVAGFVIDKIMTKRKYKTIK